MQSLPDNYKALIIGATGGIGAAMLDHLRNDPRCGKLIALSRHSTPAIDYDDESSITHAAQQLAPEGPFHLIVIATGMLHQGKQMPEKRLAQLNAQQMADSFRINTIGPSLVIANFAKLLDRNERSLLAALSAKVGSIADNRLGGWYSYRASKAALNMVIRTAAIEIARTHPKAVLAALHPGTVNSHLSKPFRGEEIGRSAENAAGDLLKVMDTLDSNDTGTFWAYDAKALPW